MLGKDGLERGPPISHALGEGAARVARPLISA
jgi:hypothetical protein